MGDYGAVIMKRYFVDSRNRLSRRLRNKIFLLIILCFSNSLTQQAQNGFYDGIVFRNWYSEIDSTERVPSPYKSRYTLKISNKDTEKITGVFTVSFDMAVWNSNYFGYILGIANSSKNFLHFTLDHFSNKDTIYLALSRTGKGVLVKIPILKEKMKYFNWFSPSLSIDLNKKKIISSIDGKIDTSSCSDLPDQFNASVNLGYDVTYQDVARVAIKNLQLKKISNGKSQTLINIPFNEHEGEHVKDIITDSDYKIENSDWVSDFYNKFHLIKQFTIPDSTQIAYDENNLKIFIVEPKRILIVNLFTYKVEIIESENSVPAFEYRAYYHSISDRLFTYHAGLGELSEFDWKTKRWTPIDNANNSDLYYRHTIYSKNNTDEIFAYFGYGWYQFRNSLNKYDFSKKKWNELEIGGENIPFVDATGYKPHNSNIVIFCGGDGNESGKQLDGNLIYEIMWKLNLDSFTNTILWWNKNEPLFRRIAPLHYDTTTNSLYTLNFKTNPNRQAIFRFDLNNFSFTQFSDFHVDCEWIHSAFYSGSEKKFYVFCKSDSARNTLKIYSINFNPEYVYKPLNAELVTPTNNEKYYLAILAISSIIILFIVLYHKKSKIEKVIEKPTNAEMNIPPNSSSSKIFLFGEFEIFNSYGANVTGSFTGKVKQLLLIILVYPYMKNRNNGGEGIHIDKITNYIWPDLYADRLKNNRNVTIARLRKLLKENLNIELINDNHFLSLATPSEFECDFWNYINYRVKSKNDESNQSEDIENSSIVARGNLLNEESYEWLDAYKISISEEINKKLTQMLEEYSKIKEYEKTIQVCDIMLKIDPVDEAAMKKKISSLIELDKKNISKKVYENFCREYQRFYAEEYQIGYEEIILHKKKIN